MRNRAVLLGFFLLLGVTAAAFAEPSISGTAVWNERGIEHYRAGNYRNAVTCFETAFRLLPDDETLRFNLASAHARLAVDLARATLSPASYAEALLHAEEAIALVGDHAYFHSVLGFVHQEKRNYGEAYAAFARAAELDPKDGGARVLMGNAAYELDDLEKAIHQWNKALDIDPDLDHVNERLDKADREILIEERFRTVENTHFRLRYDPDQPDASRIARDLLDLFDEARSDVLGTLLNRGAEKTSVVVYRPEDFRAIMGGREWTGGLYDGKIRVPFPREGDSDDPFQTLAVHEYVHAVIYEWTSDRCPAWLNEGLAQYLAGEWNGTREKEARRLAREGDLIPLASLERSFLDLDAGEVDGAYVESYVVVSYLLQTYTARHLHRLLDRIAEGEEVPDALRQVLRVTEEELLQSAFAPYRREVAAR
ncbi:MAG: tetratricopeptide repeat protein [Candidatus Eisenbacteria bacterium]